MFQQRMKKMLPGEASTCTVSLDLGETWQTATEENKAVEGVKEEQVQVGTSQGMPGPALSSIVMLCDAAWKVFDCARAYVDEDEEGRDDLTGSISVEDGDPKVVSSLASSSKDKTVDVVTSEKGLERQIIQESTFFFHGEDEEVDPLAEEFDKRCVTQV